MRLEVFLTFDADEKLAHEILDPVRLAVNERSRSQSATVFLESEQYQYLAKRLARIGLRYLELKRMHFEETELNDAEYLHMAPAGYWGYPQPEENFDLYRGESYDTSFKCPICGKGYIQNRPLLVKGRPRFGRNDILAINWEYEFLVTGRLKNLLENSDLTGADIWPLLDYKKRTPIDGFYQLHLSNELPPMSRSTEFEPVTLERLPQSPCPCGRAGRNLAFHQMIYRRRDLKDAKDFNKTHEWLGGGYGTTQWKIVSARVYRFFKKHDIRRVTFQPVVVEG